MYMEITQPQHSFKKKLLTLRSMVGPWLVTWASDDDPSGITTYSQAWAQFGLKTLWVAFITLPLMASIQEMCGRIWLVTKHGVIWVIKRHYPKYLMYITASLTIPACIMNIWADLSGMWAVGHMIVPGVNDQIRIFIFSVLMVVSIVFFPYKKIESILKRLAITLSVYFIIPFMVHQNWLEVMYSSFIPHFEWSKEYIGILVAILWTTISPYLFVWEASMEVEEENQLRTEKVKEHHRLPSMKRRIWLMQKGNAIWMVFSNIATYFIILTAGTILFHNGIHNIDTVQDAANALRPLAGDWSYALFAIGIIGTWLLTIPVLAWACSYIVSEVFGWEWSINSNWRNWRSFYLVIIVSVLLGSIMNFLGIDPIKSLIWTAILYGLTAPILIAIVIHICNNPKVMGENTNKLLSNTLWIICFVLMSVAAIAMFITML